MANIKTKIQNKIEKIKKKWKNRKISRELRDIIHGYIASDGYVRKDGTMTVDQSLAQAKFVEWMYERLKHLRTESPMKKVSRSSKKATLFLGSATTTSLRSNTSSSSCKAKPKVLRSSYKNTQSLRFNTESLLVGFHKMWYKSCVDEEGKTFYKKGLPKQMKGFFSSTFLAVWFAGDGTKMLDQKGAKFEVTNLTAVEREQLKKLFKQKFDIEVVINRAGVSVTGTTQWSLSINTSEYDKFRTLITQLDLIPNLFPHKLHPQKS